MTYGQSKYECRCLDNTDEWEDVEAWDAEEAAQDFCDKSFSDWEYPKGPIEIQVRNEDGVVETHEVTVEYVPSFHASAIELKPTGPCPIHLGDKKMQRYIRNDGFCPECRVVFPDLVAHRWMNQPATRSARIIAWKVEHPDAALDISDDDVIRCIDMNDENPTYAPIYRKKKAA